MSSSSSFGSWPGSMNEYRCYFLRPPTLRFGSPSSIDTTEEFRAETDDQARLVADTMYRKRSDQAHGYELWQGSRLVHR